MSPQRSVTLARSARAAVPPARALSAGRQRNPRRWSRHTRSWTPVAAITVNPERDAVIQTASLQSKPASETEEPHEQGSLPMPCGNLLDMHWYPKAAAEGRELDRLRRECARPRQPYGVVLRRGDRRSRSARTVYPWHSGPATSIAHLACSRLPARLHAIPCQRPPATRSGRARAYALRSCGAGPVPQAPCALQQSRQSAWPTGSVHPRW
jgi:hypothetical protein